MCSMCDRLCPKTDNTGTTGVQFYSFRVVMPSFCSRVLETFRYHLGLLNLEVVGSVQPICPIRFWPIRLIDIQG